MSFETLNSLSETASDIKGIGATRRWIKCETERCNAESTGRIRIEFDEHLAPFSVRIPQPTPIINVVATMPGEQAESRGHISPVAVVDG